MDSAILDIAIGLALLYLMLSLLVSLTSEYISRLLDLRAKTLRGWLERFLDGGVKTPLPEILTAQTMTKKFYGLPLITALRNKKAKHLPSYIPSRTFATALLDLALPVEGEKPKDLQAAIDLIQKSDLPVQAQNVVISYFRMANNDLERVRQELALWFDGAMDRVSGWYARRMQGFTLLIAIAVTLIANADTFLIVDTLWRDNSLRPAIADAAEHFTTNNPQCKEGSFEDTQSCVDSIEESLSSLNLPLLNQFEQLETLKSLIDTKEWLVFTGSLLRWLLGLIVTAAALSFGARFWFDALTKLVNIRLTGKPPAEPVKTS